MLLLVGFITSLTDLSSSTSLPADTGVSVAPCGEFEAYQQFQMDSSNPNYSILSLNYFTNSCLDCNGCSMYINALIQPCNSSTINPNQMFTLLNVSSSNAFLLNSNKFKANCLQVYDGNDDLGADGKIPLAFNTLSMQPCDYSYKTQQFNYDPQTQHISLALNSSLCLTAMKPNCTVKPFNTYPYCNQQLPSTKRAEDLVSRMTLYEKILGLNYYNPLYVIYFQKIDKNIFRVMILYNNKQWIL